MNIWVDNDYYITQEGCIIESKLHVVLRKRNKNKIMNKQCFTHLGSQCCAAT